MIRIQSSLSFAVGVQRLRRSGTSAIRFVHQPVHSGPNPKSTILLTNLHNDLSESRLLDKVKDVKSIRTVRLQPGCSLHFATSVDAESAAKFLSTENTKIRKGRASFPTLRCRTSSPAKVIELLADTSPLSQSTDPVTCKVTVRFPSTLANHPELHFNDELKSSLSVTRETSVPRPAVKLQLPASAGFSKSKLDSFLQPFAPQYIYYHRTSREGFIHSATAVFTHDSGALACVAQLHKVRLEGHAARASYSPHLENIVTLRELSGTVTKDVILSSLKGLEVSSISVDASGETAELVFFDSEDASLAKMLLTPHCGNIELSQRGDTTTTISFDKAHQSQEMVERVIGDLKAQFGDAVSIVAPEREELTLSFSSLQQAFVAQSRLFEQLHDLEILSAPQIDSTTAHTIEVVDFPTSKSVSELLEALKPVAVPVSAHRNALIRVGKHEDMVPSLKLLRKLGLGRAQPYRPLAQEGDSEYDTSPALLAQKQVDDLLLQQFVDKTRVDVITQLQLLTNSFERSLYSAEVTSDVTYLVGGVGGRSSDDQPEVKPLVPSELREEAAELLKKLAQQSQDAQGENSERLQLEDRLFDIYLQRLDLRADAKHVEPHVLLFGRRDLLREMTDVEDEEEKVEEVVEEVKPVSKKKRRGRRMSEDEDGEGDANGDEDVDVVVEKQKEEYPSQLSALMLRDEQGGIWNGTVLDTDMVQKSMPGQRVSSYRALVVIGNMRGTAGFGTGKGQTAAKAVEASFRAALKNLTHIDLFENAALAHDCFGQHNSCRAYIRATPKSRVTIASPFAEAVLQAFGISSASIKLVGRRNPYSMIHALFNAISKHENIDEFAKRRGKRYLTLKWLKDQQL